MNDHEIEIAVRAAKIAAGLDPAQKYPPLEYIEHMTPQTAQAFWVRQVDRVLVSMIEAPEQEHERMTLQSEYAAYVKHTTDLRGEPLGYLAWLDTLHTEIITGEDDE